jgi:hypothetical protein
VLDKACTVYAQQDRPLDVYLDLLQDEAQSLAGYAQASQDKALQAILLLAVSLIKERDPLAYQLLVWLAFVEEGYSFRELRKFFRRYPATSDLDSDVPQLLRAAGVLSGFGIGPTFERVRNIAYHWRINHGYLRMAENWHALVRVTLRQELSNEFWKIYKWLSEVRPTAVWRAGRERETWWLTHDLGQVSIAAFAWYTLEADGVCIALDRQNAVRDFITRRALEPSLISDLEIALDFDSLVRKETEIRELEDNYAARWARTMPAYLTRGKLRVHPSRFRRREVPGG